MIAFAGATNNPAIQVILVTIFYFFNPMFTFYLSNYQIVINYYNQKYTDQKPIVIPLVGGLDASLGLSIGCFVFQFLLYLSIVMWKDQKESLLFKKKDGNVPKIEQR
jgi:hypothetical protein